MRKTVTESGEAKKLPAKRYSLVTKETKEGEWLLLAIQSLLREEHDHLGAIKIAVAWFSRKPDADGTPWYGKINKASELERLLHGFDAVLKVNQESWRTFNDEQRKAWLDEQLAYLDQKLDADDEWAEDGHGNKMYRMRRPEVVTFSEVVKKHGPYSPRMKELNRALSEHQVPLFSQGEDGGAEAAAAN